MNFTVMNNREFIADFNGILVMLRDHGYLKYQSNKTEFELKEKQAAREFVTLLRRRTGVDLPEEYELIPSLDEIRRSSLDVIRALTGRTVRIYRQKAQEHPEGSRAQAYYQTVSELWEMARDRI